MNLLTNPIHPRAMTVVRPAQVIFTNKTAHRPAAMTPAANSSQLPPPETLGRFCPLSGPAAAAAAKSLQLCLTLCDPVNCSLPGSSVQETLQERILEWVAMPSSRGFFQPRNLTWVSCVFCIAVRFFTAEPLGKPLICCSPYQNSQLFQRCLLNIVTKLLLYTQANTSYL